MTFDIEKFVEDNADEMIEAACSFPMREAVDAIVWAAKTAGIKDEEAIKLVARAAFDAAYIQAEETGLDKIFELAKACDDFMAIEDYDGKWDVLIAAAMKEIEDTKLEPYVGDEYEQFQ